MKTFSPQRPAFPLPTLSDIGWGMLYGIGVLLGMLFGTSYAIGGMAGPGMGEIGLLFGALGLLAGQQGRLWLLNVIAGIICAWVAIDPVRDLIGSAFLAGCIVGALALLGASYCKWRQKQK